MGPCVLTVSSFFSSGHFPVGDMDRPLSSWGYGLASFHLGIWTGSFQCVMALCGYVRIMFVAKCQTGTQSLVCGDTSSGSPLQNCCVFLFVLRIQMSISADIGDFVVHRPSPPRHRPPLPSTSVSRTCSKSPPPSSSSYLRSPPPKRAQTTRSSRSASRDTSSPAQSAKPQAPKEANADDKVRRCHAVFPCSILWCYLRITMFTHNFPCLCRSLFPILF